ncbi:hypothetical protein MYXO_00572 [Myxococcaceae bacterium]|jgi:predicted nucleotidyltransferase|nr:hypothetical protein MYXO_00572 [Myxococcaceae bacterium]
MDLEPARDRILREVSAVAVIYLFGSAARDDLHASSDVDLAFLADRPLDPVARFALQERIAGDLHRDVDLVDLRTASTVMRVQVIVGGQILFERDPAERALFEASALGAYARLNEARRDILEDVRRSGRVHG